MTVASYLHNPFTVITSAKFGAPWTFILTRSDGDGNGIENITKEWALVFFRIVSYSNLTNVEIRVLDGDTANAVVVVTAANKFGGGKFEPAVFKSISASGNTWNINFEPSPDEPGTPPGNPCLNDPSVGENFFVELSAMKTAHTLTDAITGGPISFGRIGNARSGDFDGTFIVESFEGSDHPGGATGEGEILHTGQDGYDIKFQPTAPRFTNNHLIDAEGTDLVTPVEFALLCNQVPPGEVVPTIKPGAYRVRLPFFQLTAALRFTVTSVRLEHRYTITTDQNYIMNAQVGAPLGPYIAEDQFGQDYADLGTGSIGRNFPAVQGTFIEKLILVPDPEQDQTGHDLTATNELTDFTKKRTQFGGTIRAWNLRFPDIRIN